MEGIIYIENFIENPKELYDFLVDHIEWDNKMTARKTASFGKAYNYSQMQYPFKELPDKILEIIKELEPVIGFTPNNCLINYYPDGKSKMGYHSDQTDILEEGTGIAIVSVGENRTLKFKNIQDPDQTMEYLLVQGSLIYMTQEIQQLWQHAIPKSGTDKGRVSLTFREIK